ncbi:MAG: right-handed parallel beta-helix repeat-containing protein, partial [Thermoplasmatales archaeon]|nr:right-handed parallel beta-helix repeat-containing protein [Thermoplasmatales archaeon]
MKLCIKKEILIGVLIILAIFVMAVVIHAGGTEKKEDTDYAGIQDVRDGYKYTSHEPIYINGNDDFVVGENGVVSGNGTEDDAYIIEGWDIDASTTNGIDIENTDVYFIIGNCTIHNGKYNSKNGIYFYNVTNSKIDNVFSYTNYYGVRLDYSSNNSITDCTIYNNCDGIHPYYSSNNVVNACNIYDNGYSINLEYSSNNSIANCSVYNNYYGSIYLGLSSNNNRITNCTVYNNSGYGIFLHYSSDNNISTCNIYKNWYGIQLSGSSNNQILNCTLYNNSWHGINLGYSSNNEI